MMMKFPTTIEEALALPPERAEEFLDLLYDFLDETMNNYNPPEDFAERDANFELASAIDALNRISALPDNPFDSDGWVGMIPDMDDEASEQ